MDVGIWLLDQISGSPVGWRPVIRRVGMVFAIIDGQRGVSPF
jgi:hypothetical protein